ncbi:hypothetical protein FACS189425_02030 [Clostridia bacterium]|nr:hypothetical protein FACS189425_02030 [Clostridia bacterium]
MKTFSTTRKLAISGIFMALYILIMYFTQSFAFGEYQIRIATSLYALTAIFPFLILPMGLANMLSNTLMGGLGFFDIFGGLAAGLITSTLVWLISKYKLSDFLIAIPIVFAVGLIIPIWLSVILHIPYWALAVSLCVGQVVPAIVGVLLVKMMRKRMEGEE